MKKRAAIPLDLVDMVSMASRIHNLMGTVAVNLPIEVVDSDGTTANDHQNVDKVQSRQQIAKASISPARRPISE